MLCPYELNDYLITNMNVFCLATFAVLPFVVILCADDGILKMSARYLFTIWMASKTATTTTIITIVLHAAMATAIAS